MKFAAHLLGVDRIAGGLKNLGGSMAASAADAAADALAAALDETREAEGLGAPLVRTGNGARRAVGAGDPGSSAREFGTLDTDPAPWLAPSLPAARGPMRAAAAAAVARALSAFRPR